MNIKEFKVEDIITRNEPIFYKDNQKDSSYCGARMVFKGLDRTSKIIFVEHPSLNLMDLSYARDKWDEGWCKYPESLLQKIKKNIKRKK